MKRIVLPLMLLWSTSFILAQDIQKETGLNTITINVLQAQTSFLASDLLEGRETGEKGEWLSAEYIASMLQMSGIKPAGDYETVIDPSTGKATRQRTYFQNFNLMKTEPGDIQEMSLISGSGNLERVISLEYGTDFMVTPSDPSGTVSAPVVFVGYGYTDSKKGWDDFRDIDVKGKIILRIAGLPPSLESRSEQSQNYRIAGDKDRIALDAGVAAIIEVDPSGRDESSWYERRDFMNMSPSESNRPWGGRSAARFSIPREKYSAQVPRVNISIRVANKILEPAGLTVSEFESGNGLKKPVSAIPDMRITLTTTMKSRLVRVRNVLGIIEGKKSDEVIVVGAHYDHNGIKNGYVFNGADDNASGTVGVLTIARAFATTGVTPGKSILFALWTGEEKGLLGSKYFVMSPNVPFKHIRMNINFDMISRYVKDDLPDAVTMTYTDNQPLFRKITEDNINKYDIRIVPDYQPSADPPRSSDHSSFVDAGIPIMRFKPGHREEYHTPADEVSTLDWDIMEKIVRISFLNIWDLANGKW